MTKSVHIAQSQEEDVTWIGRLGNVDETLPDDNERRFFCEDSPTLPNVPKTPTEAICGLRVLVVDDNRDSAETMGMLLEIDGHEVFIAHDGKQAVDLALLQRPDVVLLDISLPYLNGYDACRAMRAAGMTNTLIVAMTGYSQEEDRRLSQEAGFDAHLVKPLDFLAVRELLARQKT